MQENQFKVCRLRNTYEFLSVLGVVLVFVCFSQKVFFCLFGPQRVLCLAPKIHQLLWSEPYPVPTITTRGTVYTGAHLGFLPAPAGRKGPKSGTRGSEERKARGETSPTSRTKRTGQLTQILASVLWLGVGRHSCDSHVTSGVSADSKVHKHRSDRPRTPRCS